MKADGAERDGIGAEPGKVLIAFQTHVFGRQVRRAFRTMSRMLPPHFEAVVLVHLPPDAPVPPLLATVPHLLVRTPEMRIPEYTVKSGLTQPDWAIWKGGHTDLPMLHLARMRPGYAFYWGIEYDVRYTGSWQRFFERYEDSDADFVGANIRDRAAYPSWHWWFTLITPDGIAPPTEAELLCSFMPVYRVSGRLIETVDRAYRTGWSGHSEIIWPTFAHRSGMPMIDLGGDGPFVRPQDRKKVYRNNVHAVMLSPGTYVFKPVKHLCWQRDMLWHPVKPIGATLQEDYAKLRGRLGRLARKATRTVCGGRLNTGR